MSEIKLVPCPFCGGEAYLETVPTLHKDEYVVCCKDKECTAFYIGYGDIGLYATKEKAIQSWNTRKPMEEIVERLDDMYQPCYLCREDRCAIDRAIEIVKEVGGMND